MSRLPFILAVLILVFFVSTSSGLASVSSIQEKLREIQLKLIKEKIKLIQESIFDVNKKRIEELALPPVSSPEPALTREGLEMSLKTQIEALESVVASLKPRALVENVARVEKRIGEIGAEVRTATGERLKELQQEMQGLAGEHADIQQQVRNILADSIKEKQAFILREQIRLLEEKIRTLPRPVPVPPRPNVPIQDKVKLDLIQAQIEQLRLKLLRAQIKVIQEKIGVLKNQ